MASTPRPPLRQDVTPVLKQLKLILFSNENFVKYLISSNFKKLLEYTNTDEIWQLVEITTHSGIAILSPSYTGKAEEKFVPFLKIIYDSYNEKFFRDYINSIIEDFERYGGKIENIEEINKKMGELNCGSLTIKRKFNIISRTIIKIHGLIEILKRIFYKISYVIIFFILLGISFLFFTQRGVSPDIALIPSLVIGVICLFLLRIIDEKVLRLLLSSK